MPQAELQNLASRHHVSIEAVEEIAAALRASGGSLAQFSHRELGGRGQWMPGMIQIGDMFNDALKAKVAALCTDVAAIMGDRPQMPEVSARGAATMTPMKPMQPMQPMKPMAPMAPMQPIRAWWPSHFGQPDAAGGQNDVRYAWFAAKRRLLVDVAGYVAAYDSADHVITGIAQSQGDRSDLRFTSQHGLLTITDLQAVEL